MPNTFNNAVSLVSDPPLRNIYFSGEKMEKRGSEWAASLQLTFGATSSIKQPQRDI